MWGFLTSLNDILVPHLKAIFDLKYVEVMLIQFSFFSAYFVFAIPSAKLIECVGYKRTMVLGLTDDGRGRLAVRPRRQRAFFSAISHRPYRSSCRNHGAAGIGEPLRYGAGTPPHSVQPSDPDAGVQLTRDHHRAVSGESANPERCPENHRGDAPARTRRIWRLTACRRPRQ